MKTSKNLVKYLITLFSFFFLSIIVNTIFAKLGIKINELNNSSYSAYELLIEFLLSIIMVIIYYKSYQDDCNKLKNNKDRVITILKYFGIFMVVKIVSAYLTTIVGNIIGMQNFESENQSTIVELTKSAPILMIIASVIFAPIVEETTFRLGLRKLIKDEQLFIVLSGLFFGFLHIFPTSLSISVALTYSITYVAMGSYLAYIYVKTDSILIPIIIHALNNLISLLAVIYL